MREMLDLSSLENAIKSLCEVLQEFEHDQRSFIKDSIVKRFEYTYELCPKIFKRYLKIAAPSVGNVDHMLFQNLVRTANEMGLFKGNWEKWKTYRDARNITSHTYDESKADCIVAIAPEFYDEATYFLNMLKKRLKEINE
ncbi:MAG: nucleotidyltransferase substrate binding protein [Holosporaceae bacterium]|jgi:nucleotidyltransferase substrate binding protein (TIGR01987 family)|nr:nucleotidyltransferase substrate binding protein [Holosporaceae bacterium]